ncbi:hypothetical protein [Pseudonocardia humida]|uniref:Integral membrane protein n=1 Tax=Pseudonocardia humida TaxID=2800819 RepID=A0ABT0ZTA7_9PSEU|nr:hypothetical protein [Pseudonocardia humida]MCO1653942.1 hypothetical protein [Pseudonocardia humida]
MFDALVIVTLVASGALAVFGLVETARGRPPGKPLAYAVYVAVGLLVVQAAIAAVRVFGGVQVPEPTTFLIYLLVSVCVLPIALQWANADPNRWGGAIVAAGAVGVAVAVLRLQGMWAVTGA